LDIPESADLFEPGSGKYSIQLKSASGVVLWQRAFSQLTHPEGEDVQFSQTVPWNPGTTNIVINDQTTGRELGRLVRRTGSPRGSFLALPSNVLTRPSRINWIMSHPDGRGELSSALLFSPDAGASWRTVAINLTTTSYVLDPGSLPGTNQGQLRLLISDGMQTTVVDSPARLRTRPKPPTVLIIEPDTGARIAAGARLVLHAVANSIQDGALREEAYRWFADGKLVGRGSKVEPRGLRPGHHEIFLVVTDVLGLMTQTRVTVDLDPASVAVLGDAPGTVLPSQSTPP
jgi:hypothetical protein